MKRWLLLNGGEALAAALAAAVVLCFVLEPIAMLRGWLAAFVWATMVPTGSLSLLVIHRITGGEWGAVLKPVLEPAARLILGVAVLSAPLLLFSGALYRWSDPQMPAIVARNYMNPPLYALRTVAALVVWSALSWMPALRSSVFGAALALAVLAVVTNIVPVDWVVSTQPGFYSSAFGFGFGFEQILVALALCAILGPQGDERRECRDLAGLLIAALLGVIYFVYVQFAIIWYGNLPGKAVWYVIRGQFPWTAIGGLAIAVGAVLPFLALLNKEVRGSTTLLRMVGAGIFAGIALHVIWLIAPSFGAAALAPSVLAVALVGSLLSVALRRVGLRMLADNPREAKTVIHD